MLGRIDNIPEKRRGDPLLARDWNDLRRAVDAESIPAVGYIDGIGTYHADQSMEDSFLLLGGCLDENHPGRSICGALYPFNIHLGTWDSYQNCWVYDVGSTCKAIDFRYGVPYPNAGATGQFTPRASDTYGTIYEVVSLDCESPGPCVG